MPIDNDIGVGSGFAGDYGGGAPNNFDAADQSRFDTLLAQDDSTRQQADLNVGADHDDFDGLTDLTIGRAGARGRDSFIGSQQQSSYNAGFEAPATSYSGDIYRAVRTPHADSYNNHSFSANGTGRFDRVGEPVLYNGETFQAVQTEMQNYNGLDGHTVVRSEFTGNIVNATNIPGLTADALMEPRGLDGTHRTPLSRLTGEDPYTHTQAFADGVRAQGADGVRVPANGGELNVNLFPDTIKDLDAAYTYVDQQNVTGGVVDPARISTSVATPVDATPYNNTHVGQPAELVNQNRAGSARYSAAGAGAAATIASLRDSELSTQDAVTVAGTTGLGAAIGVADDALVERIGAVRSGGVIDGALSAATSVWSNADAYEAGEISAGDATADVIIDTGVRVSAGMAGMAAGAAVGSVVPVVGTAAGAVIGFVAGAGASWLASNVIEGSGAADWAREGLEDVLESNFERPLSGAWETISDTQNSISSNVSSAWNNTKSFLGGLFD